MPNVATLPWTMAALLALSTNAAPPVTESAEAGAVLSQPSRQQIRVSRLFGWQPLDASSLLLWTGKEEVWRLSLASGCKELMRARTIQVTTDRRHIKIGKDKVQVGEQSCAIQSLTLPDEKLKKRYSKARKGYVANLLPWLDAPDLEPADTLNDGKV
ncbi:hypothetical protein GCM10007907_17460 [Chitinimonas prasina]|uniref:DUF2531 family protein n=2 Tax=Chitinimonas prasina TaxID=1434937 RepID=A0ABQ5YEI9_9NEIS|nr:hypothetical protein GCM10007907_17460 [Chitinimonas prasina]